jgi:hypothetical protein
MAEGRGKVDPFDVPQQWWRVLGGVPDGEVGTQR